MTASLDSAAAQDTRHSPTPHTGAHDSLWRDAWTMAPFLFFCWLSYSIFAGTGGLIYYLIQPRLAMLSSMLSLLVAIGFATFFLIIGAGLLLITATALSGIDLLYPHFKRSVTVKSLFPIAATLSQLIGFKRDRLRASFVKVNNALTIAQRRRIHGDRILVLLPHCLQIDVCNRKITHDINNCIQCGRCPVAGLVVLGNKYNLKLEVVNGGTLARKRIRQFNPSGIVAVACERDLTLGIQDAYPIPVYGVINDRPNGPCHNTCVDMSLVEEAIRFFRNDISRSDSAPGHP